MNIYESAEDYLEQILVLLEEKGYARSTDIAESLGVTKPSVSVAMKKLRENGYISMEKGGLISLTDKGYPIEKLAIQYSVSHPRIAGTLFSSANPENVKKNIKWVEEPIDWELVREVKEIIGNQQRVTWANS